MPPDRRLALATLVLAGCATSVASTPPPRPSLAAALTQASGRAVRVEAEGERVLGYADDSPLPAVDRAGGEQRAQAIFGAACTVLALDCRLLGPTVWGEHPEPTACAPQRWPGTKESTTHGLCVAFDREHRPKWIDIHWSAAIAARRDVIKGSQELLAALTAKASADVVWTPTPTLSLEEGRAIYQFSSTTGRSLDTTTVDAVTGNVLGVRLVDLGPVE